MKIINFLKSGFNWNCGYSVHTITYSYLGIPQIGYILVKNYICFWIPGYDRVEVFIDKQSLDQYLDGVQAIKNNN